MEIQRHKSTPPGKPILNRRLTRRERKLALLEDVDKLKKKLRQEENVHRALERAFSRRLGTLPHLPPYLPPQTLELLAEVAVLEEEVVRLEEEVVNFRQGLYQEAVYLSSRISIGNSDNDPSEEQSSKTTTFKQNDESKSSISQIEVEFEASKPPQHKPLNSLLRSGSCRSSYSHRIGSDFLNRVVDTADLKKLDSSIGDDSVLVKRSPQNKPEIVEKRTPKPQNRLMDQERAQESCSSSSSSDRIMEAESECNKISENVLNCLIGIFLRLSKLKAKTMDAEAFSNLMTLDLTGVDRGPGFRDPYGVCLKSRKRDIGPYKDLFAIESGSIDFKKKKNASLLIRRLKLLLEKLASVNLEGLMTHQQKLAFWINVYNICMMNAYLEHGMPESPEMMPTLMQKATINTGGYLLNAVTIEHFILRLPYRFKLSYPKSPKKDETEIRDKFGLEWSEPLVTFALCSGTWSSPAVRVYTASQVENELSTSKREYLQASFGITKTNKLIIPKMLDWYLLDFAKDLEALMDWVCLQLPSELRKQALMCLEKRGRGIEPLANKVQVMDYDYKFRYLIQR
ncbi:unnamed protein product [Lactuca virosa]|uniref:Ternary complex factor MIP1 leucine-zipper domain-containing protein n=1 Tax=Lactuca virosa TaxID=75947 RepID=A0AAU9M5K1_9ASTR|nr:unnamed protein product [Lactuca virosa]